MPANYHQRYVARQIHDLDAAEVAELIAKPPTGNAKQVSAAEIHKMVIDHADDETKVEWGLLLASAAEARRGTDWPSTWALPISRMIFDLPAPEDAPVVELGETRQAA